MAKAAGSKKINPAFGILAAILVALGIVFLIQGFVVQLNVGANTGAFNIMNWTADTFGWVFGYYLIGIILIGAGKMLKWKAFASYWNK